MSLASLRPISYENGSTFSTVLPSSLGTHERRKRKRRTCCVCTCLACSLIAGAVTLVVLLGIRFTEGSYGGTLEMYPGDTRIVRAPSSYCDKIIVNEQSSFVSVGLYGKVNTTLVPLDTVSTNVSSQLLPGHLTRWRYHVYPGTKVAVRSGLGGFYGIHGTRNYTRWVSSSSCGASGCYHSSQANISIEQEEFLYIAVMNNHTTSVAAINMSVTLYLVGYRPLASYQGCTTQAHTGSCSIPANRNGIALISIPNSNESWTDPILVQWSCEQRYFIKWTYVLLSLPAAIALMVACIFVIIHCCTIARRRTSNVPLPQLLGDASELDDDLHGL